MIECTEIKIGYIEDDILKSYLTMVAKFVDAKGHENIHYKITADGKILDWYTRKTITEEEKQALYSCKNIVFNSFGEIKGTLNEFLTVRKQLSPSEQDEINAAIRQAESEGFLATSIEWNENNATINCKKII